MRFKIGKEIMCNQLSFSKIKKQNKLDIALAFFLTLVVCGFFFLDTSAHRLVLYCVFITGFLHSGIRSGLSTAFDFKNKLFLLSFIFLMLSLLSLTWSDMDSFERILQKTKPAIFILLFLVIWISFFKNKVLLFSMLNELYILCAAITGLILLLMNLDDIYTSYFIDKSPWRMTGFGRATNENQAGLFYGIALLNLLFLKPVYIKLFENNIFKWLSAFLILGVFCFSLSRGAFFAFSCTLPIMLIFRKSHQSSRNWNTVFLFIFITIAIGVIASLMFPHITSYMIERGSTGRIEIWQESYGQYLQKPILGHGIGTKFLYELHFDNGHTFIAGHSHNLYLSILVHLGTVGFIIFSLLFWNIITSLFKYTKQTQDYNLVSIFVFGSAFGLVDMGGHYNSLSSSWFVFWIPIAMLISYQKSDFSQNNE